MLLVGIISSQTKNPGASSNFAPVILNNILTTGATIGGDYTYFSSLDEYNVKPAINKINVSGSPVEGDLLTISIDATNNTSYGYLNNTLQVFKGASTVDLSPVASTTQTGSTLNFTYTPAVGDIGKYLKFKGTVKLSSGSNKVSDYAFSDYTAIVTAAPSVLDVFDKWRFRFSGGSLQNLGNAGDAVLGTNAPSYSGGRWDFTRASSQYLTIPKNGSWVETFEVWMKFQKKNNSSTQNLIAFSSSVYIRTNSNNIQVNGQAVTTIDTNVHVMRVVFNGASSFVQIDNGSQVTFSSGAISTGSGDAYIGSSTILSNFLDGYIYEIYGKENGLLTTGEANDIWSAFGY
jgi:hypothetical protein